MPLPPGHPRPPRRSQPRPGSPRAGLSARPWALLWPALVPLLLAGCATRAVDVPPVPTPAAQFAGWSCERLDDEQDAVQQRAAQVAYEVDARVGANIVAVGLGVTVFWPALLAMRPDGPEAQELARLKGRFEALNLARQQQACPAPGPEMSASRAAAWPLRPGERLVYEERLQPRGAPLEWALQLHALRRDEVEFHTTWPQWPPTARPAEPPPGARPGLPTAPARWPAAAGAPDLAATWRQDLQGNVLGAPAGALRWQRLLQAELPLGQVLAGDFERVGDPLLRARVRGQVVARGPQTLAGRPFDVAVIELFGDAQRGDTSTRLDGVLVVDSHSGVLLRLDLRSALPEFSLQRRLVRIDGR